MDTLVKLSNYEIDVREQNMIHAMVKVGAFPHWKKLVDFDFASLRFIEGNENLVFLGHSDVGKKHLATSIGIAAAKKRSSTYFIKCHDLIQNVKRAMLENRLEARWKHYTKYRLLIMDEIGYLSIEPEDAKLFFNGLICAMKNEVQFWQQMWTSEHGMKCFVNRNWPTLFLILSYILQLSLPL